MIKANPVRGNDFTLVHVKMLTSGVLRSMDKSASILHPASCCNGEVKTEASNAVAANKTIGDAPANQADPAVLQTEKGEAVAKLIDRGRLRGKTESANRRSVLPRRSTLVRGAPDHSRRFCRDEFRKGSRSFCVTSRVTFAAGSAFSTAASYRGQHADVEL